MFVSKFLRNSSFESIYQNLVAWFCGRLGDPAQGWNGGSDPEPKESWTDSPQSLHELAFPFGSSEVRVWANGTGVKYIEG